MWLYHLSAFIKSLVRCTSHYVEPYSGECSFKRPDRRPSSSAASSPCWGKTIAVAVSVSGVRFNIRKFVTKWCQWNFIHLAFKLCFEVKMRCLSQFQFSGVFVASQYVVIRLYFNAEKWCSLFWDVGLRSLLAAYPGLYNSDVLEYWPVKYFFKCVI